MSLDTIDLLGHISSENISSAASSVNKYGKCSENHLLCPTLMITRRREWDHSWWYFPAEENKYPFKDVRLVFVLSISLSLSPIDNRFIVNRMGSRRGRLNWSNINVHISDATLEKQHRLTLPEPLSAPSVEKTIEEGPKPVQASPAKRSWMPRKDVGEMRVDLFVGNYMLTGSFHLSHWYFCGSVALSSQLMNKRPLIASTLIQSNQPNTQNRCESPRG